MGSDMREAVKKDDFEWLKTIALIKYESDRLADYCRRAINLKFKSDDDTGEEKNKNNG